MAHEVKRRLRILSEFRSLGFMKFSSVFNVCHFYDKTLSSLTISKWWRVGIEDEHEQLKLHNKLESIIEVLKYE